MSQFYSQQGFYPPPQGPEEGEYIDYEYEEEDYGDDYLGDSTAQRMLIFLSGGCLVFMCIGCCLLAIVGVLLLDPVSAFVATPMSGSDIGLTFEAPAFPDESVVNEEGVQLSIIEVNRNVALPEITPVEGRELVVITIELINKGDQEVGYSESDFKLINQFQEAYTVSPAAGVVDGALGRGVLAPGEGIEARLTFDLLAGEVNLVLGWQGGREVEPRYIYME